MLIWTELAQKDVMEFINAAKPGTKNTIKKYFLNLSTYIEYLDIMPYLGKPLNLFSKDLNIHQIIFRSHKVIYQISHSNIYILTVIHSKMDTKTIITKIINSLS